MSRLLVTVSSGLGPVEVRTFAGALAQRLADELVLRGARDLHVVTHGHHSAPRSVDLAFEGACGIAEDMVGTHLLVARSDARGKRDRKRWYVGVSCAALSVTTAVAIDPDDVSYEACRASGPGGQHVNRTASAVRAVHRPSGLSVRVESERSQIQNKSRALALLGAALARAARDRTAAAERARRGSALRVERGNPVATWRLGERGIARIDDNRDHDAR